MPSKEYYQEHKEEYKIYRRRYYRKHKEQCKAYEREHKRQERVEVFGHYSNGTFKCAHCGEADTVVLCIDHINGGGTAHRQELGTAGRGSNFYTWLKKQGFPEGYQVLCCNCNQRKKFQKKEYREAP